jgi:hypothetical protein
MGDFKRFRYRLWWGFNPTRLVFLTVHYVKKDGDFMTWYEHIFGILSLLFILFLPVVLWFIVRLVIYSEAIYIPLTDVFKWECQMIWRRIKAPLWKIRQIRIRRSMGIGSGWW